MLCGMESNRTFGISLAMLHSGLSTYGLNGHREGGEPHPPYAPTGAWYLYLTMLSTVQQLNRHGHQSP